MELNQPSNSVPISDKPDTLDSTFATASQRQLVWRKFRRHRLAVISLVTLIILYLLAILAQFISPL